MHKITDNGGATGSLVLGGILLHAEARVALLVEVHSEWIPIRD